MWGELRPSKTILASGRTLKFQDSCFLSRARHPTLRPKAPAEHQIRDSFLMPLLHVFHGYAMLCYVLICSVVQCYVIQRYARLLSAASCCAASCYVLSHEKAGKLTVTAASPRSHELKFTDTHKFARYKAAVGREPQPDEVPDIQGNWHSGENTQFGSQDSTVQDFPRSWGYPCTPISTGSATSGRTPGFHDPYFANRALVLLIGGSEQMIAPIFCIETSSKPAHGKI